MSCLTRRDTGFKTTLFARGDSAVRGCQNGRRVMLTLHTILLVKIPVRALESCYDIYLQLIERMGNIPMRTEACIRANLA